MTVKQFVNIWAGYCTALFLLWFFSSLNQVDRVSPDPATLQAKLDEIQVATEKSEQRMRETNERIEKMQGWLHGLTKLKEDFEKEETNKTPGKRSPTEANHSRKAR